MAQDWSNLNRALAGALQGANSIGQGLMAKSIYNDSAQQLKDAYAKLLGDNMKTIVTPPTNNVQANTVQNPNGGISAQEQPSPEGAFGGTQQVANPVSMAQRNAELYQSLSNNMIPLSMLGQPGQIASQNLEGLYSTLTKGTKFTPFKGNDGSYLIDGDGNIKQFEKVIKDKTYILTPKYTDDGMGGYTVEDQWVNKSDPTDIVPYDKYSRPKEADKTVTPRGGVPKPEVEKYTTPIYDANGNLINMGKLKNGTWTTENGSKIPQNAMFTRYNDQTKKKEQVYDVYASQHNGMTFNEDYARVWNPESNSGYLNSKENSYWKDPKMFTDANDFDTKFSQGMMTGQKTDAEWQALEDFKSWMMSATTKWGK